MSARYIFRYLLSCVGVSLVAMALLPDGEDLVFAIGVNLLILAWSAEP